MPRYFMEGTSLDGLEKTMMLTPNFRPRGGGVMVRQYQYRAADCDCRYCIKAEKDKKSCGEPDSCICFEERLEAGCWTHGELARYLAGEIAMNRLIDRTRRLLPPQTTTPFRDQTHLQRMTPIAAAMKRDSSPYFAAVFLLSADLTLWKKAQQALQRDVVEFGRIDIRGIGSDGYTLLQTAKDLYNGGCRVTTDELCDPQIISDELFRLIISAFVIRRYGLPARFLQ